MRLSKKQKEQLKKDIISCLSTDKEIKKIVIFGSFIDSDNPGDIDIAVFQNSNEGYLPLAMRYRKKTREISHKIPLDIFPLKTDRYSDPFLSEINNGEVIYER
ncbi:MAG: nucleotidyltransferase domain-containing protein [Desulfobacteraceae bacterium]|nr:nucleotidyltransferase domain-containing protein [Desulfobacteraceae bacterium]MCP4347961.1 nucleotidyltransferase domain-containing protein [Desulfobacterales bacterium]